MTLLPLHAAFAWILNPKALGLSFAALTIGSMVPDIEPLISYIFGASVFCGIDFPCTTAPDRLVLHSLLGAVSVDVLITLLFVKIIGMIKPDRIGLTVFSNVKVNKMFYVSAAIGSLTHVFVDWLHHPLNPIFWPLVLGNPPSYYVPGLLMPYLSVFSASFIVAMSAATLMILVVTRILLRSRYDFTELVFNPVLAINIIVESLDGSVRRKDQVQGQGQNPNQRPKQDL